jgi:hypothetical protein
MKSSNAGNMLKNDEGMVLILVMIVLLAAIIIGTLSMSSATTEVRIARNELLYKQDLCKAEGAADLLIDNFNTIVSGLTLTEDVSTDITSQVKGTLSDASSIINDADVSVSIVYEGDIEWPTTGTGNWRKNYKIIATSGNQVIEVGVTK